MRINAKGDEIGDDDHKRTTVEGFSIIPTAPMTPNPDGTPLNPFHQDAYHMGSFLGNNVAVMFKNFESEHCPYLIVINRKTGKKIRIGMEA